jgi:dTDP-4-dehydrorhamnose 3,5-epimerase
MIADTPPNPAMPFRFHHHDELPAVILVEAQAFGDDRGFFAETYRQSAFTAHGIVEEFVQDNHSRSARGVLRGLHYQKHPKAQAKLVYAASGEIFDVEVDLRRGSPTYGRWVGVTLSAENHRMLYVPVGFAHGFCVVSETADVVYKVSAEYEPALDRGVLWNDPDIGVRWPVEVPLLSPKDEALPRLRDADHDFVYRGR